LQEQRTIYGVNEPDRGAEVAASGGRTTVRHPAAVCLGPGHIVVYGNPAFVAAFGGQTIGMPAREGLIDLPPIAFAVLDAVLVRGRPAACWVRFRGEDWRMTVAPRVELGTGEVYGVQFHMRPRSPEPRVSEDSD